MFAFELLTAPARFVFLRGFCPEWNVNPKLHAVRLPVKNRLRVRIARRQPMLGYARDGGSIRSQAKRPAKPAHCQSAPRLGLHPKFQEPGPRSPVGYWPPRPALCFAGAIARSGMQTPSCTLSDFP